MPTPGPEPGTVGHKQPESANDHADGSVQLACFLCRLVKEGIELSQDHFGLSRTQDRLYTLPLRYIVPPPPVLQDTLATELNPGGAGSSFATVEQTVPPVVRPPPRSDAHESTLNTYGTCLLREGLAFPHFYSNMSSIFRRIYIQVSRR